jgi:hypothetical protein
MNGRLVLTALACALPVQAQQWFQPMERNHFEPDPGSLEALVVIDVDGDGHPDLLVRSTSGAQSYYRNDGHAAFTARALVLQGDLRADRAVGDVDGDGSKDLLLGGVLHRNLGGGAFGLDAAALPSSAQGADRQTLVDLDGDGHPDLLARIGSPAHLGLFHNDGSGHFTDLSAALPFASAALLAFAVTDADRDGAPDVVAVFAGAGAQLLHNDRLGHFAARALPALPPAATSLAAGDLDQDGTDDLFAGGAFFHNDGTGSYTPLTALVFTQPLQQVAIANAQLVDVDGDGRADLVDADGWNGWFHNEGWLAPGTVSFFLSWFTPFPWGGLQPLQYADLDGDLDLDAVGAGGRPRLLLQTSGEFHDAVQEYVVLAPQRPQPLRDVDARVYAGPGPFTELAWIENGTATLLTGRTPALAPSFPGAYGGVFMPQVPLCTSVALCDSNGRGDYSLVACTPQGGRFLLRVGPWALTDRSDLLHCSGVPVSVACGRVTNGPVDDVVVGAAGVDGPQILTADATGNLWPVVPSLPPPSAPGHPLNELVRLADFDGDGDLDILHELRIVRNDGNRAFSLGPDFSALVPLDAVGLAVLDFDGDGFADLVIWSSSTPLRLLRNLGASFADVSVAHLPSGLGLPTSVSVGDVDRDGDPDLLLGIGGRAALLRNDNGMFVLVPDVGPEGVLIDMDGDLDPDLFDGARIHHNLHAQLHAPRLPTLGADYRLDVHCWPSAQPALGVLAVGSRAGYFNSPFLGPLRLDPSSAVAVGVTLGNGVASVAMPIPRTPLFLGAGFFAQAAILDGNRLHCTNDLHETIR